MRSQRIPHRLKNYWPPQDGFQQVTFRRDRLRGGSERRVAFSHDDQSFVPSRLVPSRLVPSIFNLNAADVTVVSRVQGVGQSQNGSQLNGCFLLVRQKIAQSLVLPGGQLPAVKTRNDGGALLVCGLPAQRISVGTNQIEGSFFMAFLTFGFADIVEKSGGEQARSGGGSVNSRLPSPAQKAVVELDSQAGDPLGVGEVGIEAVRPEFHTARGQQLYLPALGQRGAPHLPERIGANHFGAVLIDALGALGEDSFMPVVARTCIGKNLTGIGRGPKHIEIMNLTEQILDFLEVVAPSLVLDGKKILYDITEAFDSDPQAVERDLRAVAQSTGMEFTGSGPALQSKMFKERAPRTDAPGANGKRLAPRSPLFAIKLFKSGLSLVPLLALTAVQDLEKGVGNGIG